MFLAKATVTITRRQSQMRACTGPIGEKLIVIQHRQPGEQNDALEILWYGDFVEELVQS